MKDIYPVFDLVVQRKDKEAFLKQRSKVIWFTGLSGAGKTTIATVLQKKLHEQGFFTQLLDGDNVRTGINNNLGFSEADRYENIRRIAEVCKLFLNCGIITIASFVSPTNELRTMAREIIGDEDFIEIYVNAPLEVCESRDVKGLYKKARSGEVCCFTGISSPFDIPEKADIELKTDKLTIEEAVQKVLDKLLPLIR